VARTADSTQVVTSECCRQKSTTLSRRPVARASADSWAAGSDRNAVTAACQCVEIPVLGDLGIGRVERVWSRAPGLERQIGELMDRYAAAGEDHAARAGVLEEYLRLAYSDSDGSEMFEVYAWTESLAEHYLALGRVDDAVRVVLEATGRGEGEGAELLCELAETLMRSGHEPTARGLWERARAGFGDDVWVYVQAGIEFGDLGDHGAALTWLTAGIDLALRTGDPESALEQLVPLRAAALSAAGQVPDDIQVRAGHALAQQATPGPTAEGPR
jgi:hypothetical protein